MRGLMTDLGLTFLG